MEAGESLELRVWKAPGSYERRTVPGIYADDTRERMAAKVMDALGLTELPFLWARGRCEPLLFSFRGIDRLCPESVPSAPAPTTAPRYLGRQVGIEPGPDGAPVRGLYVFPRPAAGAMGALPGAAWLFPTGLPPVAPSAAMRKEEELLACVREQVAPEQVAATTQRTFVRKATYQGRLPSATAPAWLGDLWDAWATSEMFPFLQWIDDAYRVLYKVREGTPLAPAWTDPERFMATPGPNTLVAYSPIDRDQRYWARLVVHGAEGTVTVSYSLDPRARVGYEDHLARLTEAFQRVIGGKVRLAETDLALHAEVPENQVSIEQLASRITRLSPLYHVIATTKSSVTVVFKRTSNYTRSIPLYEYVHSLLDLNMAPEAIAQELAELGISPEETEAALQEAASGTRASQRVLENSGTILRLARSPLGFSLLADHVPSTREYQSLLRWLSATIAYTRTLAPSRRAPRAVAAPTVAAPSVAPAAPAPVLPPSLPPQAPPSPPASVAASEESLPSDLDILTGGAIAPKYHRYFLNMLRNADPNLFGDAKDYAARCGVTPLRQPIALSPEKAAALPPGAFDNSVTYGSPGVRNVYACPRVWCPESEVPLPPGGQQTCPKGEAPIELYKHEYWKNDPTIPHYLSFQQDKTRTGLCLPCCGLRKPAQKKIDECVGPAAPAPGPAPSAAPGPSAAAEAPKEGTTPRRSRTRAPSTEETHIMNQPAPVPEGRHGTLPRAIHDQIDPSIPYPSCSRTLTSQECYLRRGIAHGDDSFLAAIAFAMGYPGKKDFLVAVGRALDPISLMGLEATAQVLTLFAPGALSAEDLPSGIEKEARRWAQSSAPYRALFARAHPRREVALFLARQRLLDYLRSPAKKDPGLLYALLGAFRVRLLLWRTSSPKGAPELFCPPGTAAPEAPSAAAAPHTILVLQDAKSPDLYEPIVRKARATTEQTQHVVVPELAKHCPAAPERVRVAELRGLATWVREMLEDAAPYQPDTAVLSPDLRISHIRLRNGLVVALPEDRWMPASDLADLLAAGAITRAVFHEDLAAAARGSRGSATPRAAPLGTAEDTRLLQRKLASIGLALLERVPPLPPHIPPVLPIGEPSGAQEEYAQAAARLQRSYNQLEKMALPELLGHYDTLVAPLRDLPREERVTTLLRTFPHVPAGAPRAQLRQLLSEMPLDEGKPALAAWWRAIRDVRNHRFYDRHAHKKGKEWSFSQAALTVAVRDGLRGIQPRAMPGPEEEEVRPVALARPPRPPRPGKGAKKGTAATPAEAPAAAPGPLPALIDPERTTPGPLPSKWSQIRASDWSGYRVLLPAEGAGAPAAPTELPEFVEWLAGQVGIQLQWPEVVYDRNRRIREVVSTAVREQVLLILQDPALLRIWSAPKPKVLRPAEVYDRILLPRTPEARGALWAEKVARAAPAAAWPLELDLYATAQLLELSILIIYDRGSYGEGAGARRGSLADLAASSFYYRPPTFTAENAAWKNRPLVMLFRITHPDHFEYRVVMNKNNRIFFARAAEAPKEVQDLLAKHMGLSPTAAA